jgi:E3 ubiquitin-protein ligase UBR7
LSGSNDKECTYFQGYVKRQALYSCLTCIPAAKEDPKTALALCLACSLSCHENHELIELYTKRNIRCDCGVKTGSSACQIDPTKKIIGKQPNERNKYNQNFSGAYCTCHRPYPDPEDPIEDEMIQCIICEDWYHSRHLEGSKVPDSTLYSEMICGECMSGSVRFLFDYAGNAVQVVDEEASRNESTLNVTSLDESAVAAGHEDDDENPAKKIKLADNACTRPTTTFGNESAGKAMFWREDWRKSLCKCIKCMNMYDQLNVEFLVDLEDTTHCYEEKGKEKGPKSSMYEEQLAALATLPRVNQIDAISSYTRMKEKLFEFLQTFVVNNQIVTEEDVKRFFQNMKESENQQVPQQPHFCR